MQLSSFGVKKQTLIEYFLKLLRLTRKSYYTHFKHYYENHNLMKKAGIYN